MAAVDGTPCCAGRTDSDLGCWASAAGHSEGGTAAAAAEAAAEDRLGERRTRHRRGRSGRRCYCLRRARRGGNASSSHRSHRHARRSDADAGRARSRLPVIQMNVLQ